MQAVKIETNLNAQGEIHLKLPFQPGARVEVIVLGVARGRASAAAKEGGQAGKDPRYPLRGEPIEYLDPTEPVAEEDWEVLG